MTPRKRIHVATIESMKYTGLLKKLAKELGHDVLWSPPQLVNGSINPPPSLQYPGLTCYLAQVRVGSKEYTGFGRTAVAARHFAEYKAYMDLYFHVQEERARERENVSVSDSQNASINSHESGEEAGRHEAHSQRCQCDKGKELKDVNHHLKRFADKCQTYFMSTGKAGHGVEVTPTITPSTTGEGAVCEQCAEAAACPSCQCVYGEEVGVRDRENCVGGGNSSTEVAVARSEAVSSVVGCPSENKSSDTVVNPTGKESCAESANTERVAAAKLTLNPIGQLQELLMQEGLPLPTYQFSSSSQSQNGLRTYQCVAHANGLVGEGKAWKKSQAKQEAAISVLVRMEEAGINISPVSKSQKKAAKQKQKLTPPHLTTVHHHPHHHPPPPPPPPPPHQPSLLLSKSPLMTTPHRPALPLSSTPDVSVTSPVSRPHPLPSRPHPLQPPRLSVLPPCANGILRPRHTTHYFHFLSMSYPGRPIWNPPHPVCNLGSPRLPSPALPLLTFPQVTPPAILPPRAVTALTASLHSSVSHIIPEREPEREYTALSYNSSCHSSSSSNTNSIEITTISSDDGGTEGGTEGGADAECRAGTVAGSGYGGGRNEQLVLCRRKKWTPDLLSKPISIHVGQDNQTLSTATPQSQTPPIATPATPQSQTPPITTLATPRSLPPHPLLLQMELSQSSPIQFHHPHSLSGRTRNTFIPATSKTPGRNDTEKNKSLLERGMGREGWCVADDYHTHVMYEEDGGTGSVLGGEESRERERGYTWDETSDGRELEVVALPVQGSLPYQFH